MYDISRIERVQALSLLQIPEHCCPVFASRGTERSVRRDCHCIQVPAGVESKIVEKLRFRGIFRPIARAFCCYSNSECTHPVCPMRFVWSLQLERAHTLTSLSQPADTMTGADGDGENRTHDTHSVCPCNLSRKSTRYRDIHLIFLETLQQTFDTNVYYESLRLCQSTGLTAHGIPSLRTIFGEGLERKRGRLIKRALPLG